jgi:hypothetical protein
MKQLTTLEDQILKVTALLAAMGGSSGGGAAGGAGYAPKTTLGAGTIVPSNVLQDWSLFNAARKADDAAASLVLNQTNNINGSTSPSAITTATLNGIAFGQAQLLANGSGSGY